MDKLEKIKTILNNRRNLDRASLITDANETDGYFDPQEYSGGNFDDCFYLGIGVGEAELIEELLEIINE